MPYTDSAGEEIIPVKCHSFNEFQLAKLLSQISVAIVSNSPTQIQLFFYSFSSHPQKAALRANIYTLEKLYKNEYC